MSKANPILSKFSPLLTEAIEKFGITKEFPAGTEILREGQYVKVIPIVLSGLVKVYAQYDGKELLLYYIRPEESCIMSFSAQLTNQPSKVFAVIEETAEVLLIPVGQIGEWIQTYPELNTLFYEQYNLRYSELLNTIHHILFDKLDKRLYDYLVQKSRLTKKNPIKLSHRVIASELGTAREVISRVIKRLEQEGKVKQLPEGIKVNYR